MKTLFPKNQLDKKTDPRIDVTSITVDDFI
jgi:hypothetical protein